MRHTRFGAPRRVIAAAAEALAETFDAVTLSPIVESAPIGPSNRRYANAAAIVEAALAPDAMLAALQAIERDFGRVRRGQRWRARVLDLDIVLWSSGAWATPSLTIPHPQLRERPFVLGPAAAIAPGWRDPLTGCTLTQLHRRLTRPRGLHR